MKPYIEKNDGVPDNNRYSEALEAAKETVEALTYRPGVGAVHSTGRLRCGWPHHR